MRGQMHRWPTLSHFDLLLRREFPGAPTSSTRGWGLSCSDGPSGKPTHAATGIILFRGRLPPGAPTGASNFR
jgi:hypothetical protein